MSENRILIVEDDGIIARHISVSLRRLGYPSIFQAASGIEAVQKVVEVKPDLILMDISLKGEMDGIQAAESIHQIMDCAVIYLTAYDDEATLERARQTNPYGYLLKPFDERNLQLAIMMALHKYELETRSKTSETHFRTLIQNQSEGVIIVDPEENIIFVNPAAAKILGQDQAELISSNFRQFISAEQYEMVRSQTAKRAAGEKSTYELEIISKNSLKHSVVVNATPWFNQRGQFSGALAIFHDITEQKRIELAEKEQRVLAEALRDTAAALNSSLELSDVLQQILNNLSRVVPHEAANIMLIDRDYARVVRGHGYTKEELDQLVTHIRFDMTRSPTFQWMMNTGEAICLPDTTNSDMWLYNKASSWIHSYMGAPIRLQDRVVGFINLDSITPGFYNGKYTERLIAFANQAAIAIRNAQLYEETENRARYLSILSEITSTALGASNLETMLPSVAELLRQMFKAKEVYIALWDSTQNRTIPFTSAGENARFFSTLDIQAGDKTLTAAVLETGTPLMVKDIHASEYMSQSHAAQFPPGSLLGIPLISGSEKLGAILLGFQIEHPFKDEEFHFGQQAANQVALAISKVRLLEVEQQKSNQLLRANTLITALSHVAARVEAAPDLDAVIRTLSIELYQLGIHSVVTLYHSEDQTLLIRFSSVELSNPRFAERFFRNFPRDLNVDIHDSTEFRDLLMFRQPQFRTNLLNQDEPFLPGIPKKLGSYLTRSIGFTENTNGMYLPLVSGQELIGILGMWGETLQENDLSAMTIFSSQVAIALENARLYSEVQRLAVTDDLTNLSNRRGLLELGQREVERARRFHRPLAVIMLDVDNFKVVNDTYDHFVGDQVLKQVALRCRKHIRDIDLIGRFGGDEFVVLMPETDQPCAYEIAERVRCLVSDMPILTTRGNIQVTISLGITQFIEDSDDLASLIHRADQAMYLAKTAGRNRIFAHNHCKEQPSCK